MKICAVTMVYRDYWALAKWYRHYGNLVGKRNLFIIAHGHDDKISEICPDASIITVPRDDLSGFDQQRGRLLNSIQSGLGHVYDWVIRTDVDELVLVDPAEHSSLQAVFEAHQQPALFALGFDWIDLSGDISAAFTGHYSKAWAVSKDIPLVRHGVKVPKQRLNDFPFVMPRGVYLAHLKYANIAELERSNEHRKQVASTAGDNGPGKAWLLAEDITLKFFSRVAAKRKVSWTEAKNTAFAALSQDPKRISGANVVRARFEDFDLRSETPEWFDID